MALSEERRNEIRWLLQAHFERNQAPLLGQFRTDPESLSRATGIPLEELTQYVLERLFRFFNDLDVGR